MPWTMSSAGLLLAWVVHAYDNNCLVYNHVQEVGEGDEGGGECGGGKGGKDDAGQKK
jgi:hypothetical protein